MNSDKVKAPPRVRNLNSRNQSLDVLRGIAVLMVIFSHYFLTWDLGSTVGIVLGRGVDLFFVLSGYLISGLLFEDFKRTGTINLRRFWIRRGLKIYPAFYAMLGFTVIVFRFHAHGFPPGMWSELFFVQSYIAPIWPHTWSLAVEEHFYVALPLLLL